MAMREIEDPLASAIIGTEKEIFGDAFDREESVLDETGDRSVEQMGEGLEGQHEVEDDSDDEPEAEEAEGEEVEASADKDGRGDQGEVKAEPEKTPARTEPEGRVPPGRLREATERTRTVEAERDALKTERDAFKSQIDTLSGRFEQMSRQLEALQRPNPAKTEQKTEPAPVPDIFENPQGFVDHLNKGFKDELARRDQMMDQMRVETSMKIAHRFHGDTFAKAFEAVQKLDSRNPDDRVTVQRIYGSPDPGEALVSWHKRAETLREVGDDPAKYREKVQQEARAALMADPEFRKQLVDDLRKEAAGANTGKPNTVTRLPRSLNGAAGGNSPHAGDAAQFNNSDQSVFDSAFG